MKTFNKRQKISWIWNAKWPKKHRSTPLTNEIHFLSLYFMSQLDKFYDIDSSIQFHYKRSFIIVNVVVKEVTSTKKL